MDIPVEEQYLDVLQNIEAMIVQSDEEVRDLTDMEVGDVLDALIQTYSAEAGGRSAPILRLSPLKRKVYDNVRTVCEWRLGREPLEEATPDGKRKPKEIPAQEGMTAEAMVACLKRLRLSMKRWTHMGGRRGYLEFIRNYVG